ncbi:MAG: DUF1311 domain-containing protein [Alphaproteobacteria bacterium]|nr:DUF1311 domain-containing protein [Alphaproteobacteria bacterium]
MRPILVPAILCLVAGVAFAQTPASPTQPAKPPTGPSFDCTKAKSGREKVVCAHADLAALDRTLAEVYAKEKARRDTAGQAELQREQVRWLGTMPGTCGVPDTAGPERWAEPQRKCLADLYRARTTALAGAAVTVPASNTPQAVIGRFTLVLPSADAGSGRLSVSPAAGGKYRVQLETVIGPTAHTCAIDTTHGVLEGGMVQVSAPAEIYDRVTATMKPTPCNFRIISTMEGVRVDVGESQEACRSFCGARAFFHGDYKRAK